MQQDSKSWKKEDLRMNTCDSRIQMSNNSQAAEADDVSRKIGIIFRHARNRRSLSQISLSEAANINSSYYCSIERGTANLTIKKFISICDGLGVEPDVVMRSYLNFSEIYKMDDFGPKRHIRSKHTRA
jgi:DNA-binding XRE family transcriptional regulator